METIQFFFKEFKRQVSENIVCLVTVFFPYFLFSKTIFYF